MALYNALRGALKAKGMNQADIARYVFHDTRSTDAVSRRFAGRTPWTLDEAWAVMKLLQLPAKKFHLYFPRDGMDGG